MKVKKQIERFRLSVLSLFLLDKPHYLLYRIMNRKANGYSHAIMVFFLSFLFVSCVEKSGYYSEGEEVTISLICDINWMNEAHQWDNGETTQSVWDFERDGTYTRTDFTTAPDGTEHHSQLKGRWAFTNPSQATLLIGHEHYWDIEKLNKQLFAFYDRMGELGDLSMTREYVELKPRRQASN